jgi:homoserine/homoserine lactone efflux protein
VPPAKPSARAVFLQGFLIAITNPKALVFYLAFLPQFIDARLAAGPQLLVMIGTMIVMALLSDGAYALLAARARSWFITPARLRLQNRITGTLLICVGCGLLLVRRGT